MTKRIMDKSGALLLCFALGLCVQGAACLGSVPDGDNFLDPGTAMGIIPYIPSPEPDLSVGAFSVAGSMRFPRRDYAAVKLNDGRIFISGGIDIAGNLGFLNQCEIYDPATDTFTATANSMSVSRHRHSAVLLNDGRVLITGTDNFSDGNKAEIFDPSTGAFTTTGNMNDERFRHTSVLMADGRVLIMGGCRLNCGTQTLSSAEIFNPGTGNFTTTGSMPVPRHSFRAVLIGTRVLTTGGIDDSTGSNPLYRNEAEWYSGGTFTSLAGMTSERGNHTLTKLSDTRYLLAAGHGASDQLTSLEIFDSTTETFSAAPGGLNRKRDQHSAVVFQSDANLTGKVLIMGGYNGDSSDELVFSSVELYDPDTGQSIDQPSMSDNHYGHSAFTITRDGKEQVIVIAGSGGTGTDGIFQFAELFIPF